MHPRPAISVVASIALLAIASGCSASDPDGPPANSVDEALKEYRKEQATLTLPEGAEWPEEPIARTGPDGAKNIFQPGFGTAAADRFWFCAWEGEILDAESDEAREKAVEVFATYPETYAYQKADSPETKVFNDELISDAQLGDLSALAQDHEQNCQSS